MDNEIKKLDVVSSVVTGEINTNLEEIIRDLNELIVPFVDYNFIEYTDVDGEEGYLINHVKLEDAKGIRPKLNKIKTLINDEKKRIKKEYMAPYVEMEDLAKEAMEIVDKGIKNIDGQLKLYDQMEAEQKENEIRTFFEELNFDLVTFEQVFDKRWLNKTTSTKKWQEELEGKVKKISNDIDVIMKMDYDDRNAVVIEYLNNDFDITKAVERYEAKQRVEQKLNETKDSEFTFTIRATSIDEKERIIKILDQNNIKWSVK